MDEDLLDVIDSSLSVYISGDDIDQVNVQELNDSLEKFTVSCRNKEISTTLVRDEKDFLNTLGSFLRAAIENQWANSAKTSIVKVMQCFTNALRNYDKSCKVDAGEVCTSLDLGHVCYELLGKHFSGELFGTRLCLEIAAQV